MKENISAEEFFDKEFFPLFFDNEKHLMHVGNSPFFQKPKPGDIDKFGRKSLAQYNNLKTSIENDIPNMSIYVGAGSKDIGSTTSGQLSDIETKTTKEDIYASWIGEALGICVSGGIVMLIDEGDILWILYSGWKYYREYLDQTPYIKDKQIETWNGQWLWHTSQYNYDENYPLDNFEVEHSEIQGNKSISTQEWVKIIFALAHRFPTKTITAYSYSLSQTNTTLGFINLYLPEVHNIIDVIDALFPCELQRTLSDKEFKSYTTFYNYKMACSFGTIGLKTLEPDRLREYMPRGSVPYAQGKDYKFNNEESNTNYKLFKTWIIAMLNKMELLQRATQIAEIIITVENQGKKDGTDRGKTDKGQKIKEFLTSKKKESFINGLKELMEQVPEKKIEVHETMKEILDLPIDQLPLFTTLIQFECTYLKLELK
jgi:archaellum component FlaC